MRSDITVIGVHCVTWTYWPSYDQRPFYIKCWVFYTHFTPLSVTPDWVEYRAVLVSIYRYDSVIYLYLHTLRVYVLPEPGDYVIRVVYLYIPVHTLHVHPVHMYLYITVHTLYIPVHKLYIPVHTCTHPVNTCIYLYITVHTLYIPVHTLYTPCIYLYTPCKYLYITVHTLYIPVHTCT